jgi:hypothetical protein
VFEESFSSFSPTFHTLSHIYDLLLIVAEPQESQGKLAQPKFGFRCVKALSLIG